jgi:hypothetical protein
VFGQWQADVEFLDAGEIGTSVYPGVYTSFWNGDYVIGSQDSWYGQQVCLDGSFTGQNCGDPIVDTLDACVYADGVWTCGLTHVYAQFGGRMCQPGDSGGPVYFITTPLLAMGLFDAGNGAGTSCYYSELSNALRVLNVGLVVR